MRVDQAYVSKSVSDFPFHEIYSLNDYNDIEAPCVFFGNYRFEDLRIIRQHKGKKLIFWTGQDALNFQAWDTLNEAEHFCCLPKVYEKLNKYYKVRLVPPSSFLKSVNPQQIGTKIYAYCPSGMALYHGVKVVEDLRTAGYEITIGDGQIPQHLWKHSCNAYYNDLLIGLCLSSFAGGGTSIIEMGLRGVRVITNVLKLPNCIGWHDAQDIAGKIEKEKVNIGITNSRLAGEVWSSLDHKFEWLTL